MRKKSVLVVEDDSGLQDLLAAVLRPHCARIDVAADGEVAIAMIRQGSYDVVILDIMLPRANGFVVADAVCTLSDPPYLIVISAIGRYCQDRFPAGTLVLQKPFDVRELEAAVNRGRPVPSTIRAETPVLG